MFEHKKIQNLDDFFVALNMRKSKSVYFYRINGYNEEINQFVQKYYELARTGGVIIEGKIPNPDESNLSFYQEMMGDTFQLDKTFIANALKKWLPRMNDYQCIAVADSVYNALLNLKNLGKNENMLKNSYIKFMCWLYYRFERVVNRLGENDVPKILYEGEIGRYELVLITILSNAGCDVVLLQYNGDGAYLAQDPKSFCSDELNLPNMTKFPANYNLKWVSEEVKSQRDLEKLYGQKPSVLNCTNAWITGKALDDIRKPPVTRGKDEKLFYNCFCRINGVEDKVTYQNELYTFYLEIKNSKRNFIVLENSIPQPTAEEIEALKRGNYANKEQMITHLSSRIKSTNPELERLAVKAFIDVILEEAKKDSTNLNKLTMKAVYIICLLKRYWKVLFDGWSMPFVSCFIYLGGCKNDYEALLLKTLSKLPVDVLVLLPNLNTKCVLEDKFLYEMNFEQSLVVEHFPTEENGLQLATAAYHAERELDEVMYNDSGLYRNRQYSKAVPVTLKTMYEEIAILWDQELKFRPNFSTVDNVVNMPVLFAKVSGVKDGNVTQYWSTIKSLMTEDTFVITSVPYINSLIPNPMKNNATNYFKNGKVQRAAIKASPHYQYGMLREDTQDYILDKLQMLIDKRLIEGTFENGTEYMIVSTILNIQTELLRLIQKFDFTKKNPKVLYINTTEAFISKEDSILLAFLNLVGFDIVFFVPTGYQSVERFFTKSFMDEHQIGEYMYDLRVPNFGMISGSTAKGVKKSWRERLFKKGR